MSNTMKRYDQIIGGATDDASHIKYSPSEAGRADTNVAAELDSLNSDLSWKSLTHNTATVTQIDEGAGAVIVSNNTNIKNANEVVIPFTQNRIGQIKLTRTQNNTALGLSTYISGAYMICVKAYCDFDRGTLAIGCATNSWSLATIPVSVSANSVLYR